MEVIIIKSETALAPNVDSLEVFIRYTIMGIADKIIKVSI